MMMRSMFDVREGKVWCDGDITSPPHVDILEVLGKGANGIVFRALDKRLERFVAVKLWFPQVVKKNPDRAAFEARKLAAIRHRLFVTVHDFEFIKNVPCMIMELIPGETVKKWLKKNQPIHQRRIVWNAYSEALRFAYHEEKQYHGDPHTGNMLIRFANGYDAETHGEVEIKIMDMGTSSIWDKRENFVKRESELLCETCYRLFPKDDPRALIDERVFANPILLLDALDAFIEITICLQTKINNENDEGDGGYEGRSIVNTVAITAFDLPVFKLDVLLDRVNYWSNNKYHRLMFLNMIDMKPNGSKNSWTSNNHINADKFPEILERYNKKKDDWWQEKECTMIKI